MSHPKNMPSRFALWSCAAVIACYSSVPQSFAVEPEEKWEDVSSALTDEIFKDGTKPDWPGGCSGVVVDRKTGAVVIKVVGRGLWRSEDQGGHWKRIDDDTISGRDETGWATNGDPNAPERVASFSLDGTAGWTTDGIHWTRFSNLGRNWDFGSVDWASGNPQTIIAAKHETTPPGEVYVTSDGGMIWKQLSIHLNGDRNRVSMVGAIDATTFIYANGDGIQRSTDGGSTWSKVSPIDPQTRIPVNFRGAFYLGSAKGLLVSRDKGATWQEKGGEVSFWQGPFFGRDESEMMVAGKEGIFKTTDAGTTWQRVAGLKAKGDGFLFTVDWFGCYAWDPVNNFLYASAMANPVYRLKL